MASTKRWHLSPVGLQINIDESQGRGGVIAYEIPAFPSLRLWNRYQETASKDASSIDAFAHKEVSVLVDLCCGLACCNVERKNITPSRQLQASRARKGKKPLFEYKVLVVPDAFGDGVEGSGNIHGRNSPRSHLRRGHIRRLGEGRVVWVQACMVKGGTPGIVVKDYSLTKVNLVEYPHQNPQSLMARSEPK
jgi:hypothetical protein